MGVTDITVHDGDTVESTNGPMSLYRPYDLGRKKVDALKEIILFMTRGDEVEITTVDTMYDGGSVTTPIVISCVDSMATRRALFNEACNSIKTQLFLDTRTAESYLELYAINPWSEDEKEVYEGTLFTDEEGRRQYCGQHGIIYVPLDAGGAISARLSEYWMNGKKELCLQFRCDRFKRAA